MGASWCSSAAPTFRVRFGAGAWLPVLLAPGATEQGVKEAVALRLGLPAGSFGIQNAAGVPSVFHARLVGDWDAALLPERPQLPEQPGAGSELLAAVRELGATGTKSLEMLRQLQAAVAGVRQRLSPVREGDVGRIFAAGGSVPSSISAGTEGGSIAPGALLPVFDAERPGGGSGGSSGSGHMGGGGGGGPGL